MRWKRFGTVKMITKEWQSYEVANYTTWRQILLSVDSFVGTLPLSTKFSKFSTHINLLALIYQFTKILDISFHCHLLSKPDMINQECTKERFSSWFFEGRQVFKVYFSSKRQKRHSSKVMSPRLKGATPKGRGGWQKSDKCAIGRKGSRQNVFKRLHLSKE